MNTMTADLFFSVSGNQLPLIIKSGLFPSSAPTELTIDSKNVPVSEDWLKSVESSQGGQADIEWGPDHFVAYFDSTDVTRIRSAGFHFSPSIFLELLSSMTFEIGATAALRDAWNEEPPWGDYLAEGFADMHVPHGWGCFFQGSGHDRLVSRRWLDYGPWLCMRAPRDTTLVIFYDPNADGPEAYEQARVGHSRMGISDSGGFLQTDYYPRTDLSGIYDAEEKTLRRIVHDRSIGEVELLDVCALRLEKRSDNAEPIENIAYVFTTEEHARKHLHELWLREIQCWAFIDGEEIRLDEDYTPPPPDKPQWVKDLEAREST